MITGFQFDLTTISFEATHRGGGVRICTCLTGCRTENDVGGGLGPRSDLLPVVVIILMKLVPCNDPKLGDLSNSDRNSSSVQTYSKVKNL